MKQRHLAFTGSAIAALLAACAPGTPIGPSNATLSCVHHGAMPPQFSATFTAPTVERCLWEPARRALSITMIGSAPAGGNSIALSILNVTGPGRYTTRHGDPANVSTVAIRATASANPPQNVDVDTNDSQLTGPGACSGPAECTLDLAGTIASTPVGRTGSVSLVVNCTRLTGAGIGCVECASTGPIRIEIPSCSAE